MDTPIPPLVDDSIGGLLLALLWSFVGISACIVGLRLFTGVFILGRIKLPDYLIVMAFVRSTSLSVACAEADFLNRFSPSSKLHSLPLLFVGVWEGTYSFSTMIRSSIP
jgi:hypothetical protein